MKYLKGFATATAVMFGAVAYGVIFGWFIETLGVTIAGLICVVVPAFIGAGLILSKEYD